MINIDEFIKIEIRAGLVEEVIDVEKSEKLYKLRVRFGENEVRTIFSGIKKHYEASELKGKKFGFVTNLEPRAMMGEVSEGMIMAFESSDGKVILWEVLNEVEVGARVR